ncbi:type IV secretory system conjugative DNA transfer family protein [Miltoncostaea oceani]|uniref:type IV secretory system conjugative DNA transfer family protein n=1 Tax=Miltoncostaea oceani TaxID=2843216 RepID=UPI001C3DD088|nr:type IV secretory system conjugative DNA transfer family protein [Miltoncostaea oceani]
MSPLDRGAGSPDDPWVSIGFALAAGALGIAFIVWGIGQLAGLALGDGALSAGLGQMPGVLSRLPSTLSDPAAAWPAPDRSRLPGPAGFYAVTVTVLGGLAAVGLAAARVARCAPWAAPASRGESGARWARASDLRALVVRGAQPGRLTLGRLGRRLVATEPRASTIVIGPSQSGKTAGLAIPAILEAAGPVLAVSVKRDLLDRTLAARGSRGEVWIYDPTGAAHLDDERVVGWDPVRSCVEWADARRMAHNLTSAQAASGSRDAEFWLQMAAKLLAPLLLAAAGKIDGSMRDVVSWVDSGEQTVVADLLLDLGEPDAHAAFTATCRREERTLSSVYATTEAVLAPFADPAVLESTARHGIDTGALLDGRNTLYIVAPAKDQERLAPLFAGLVEHVVDAAYARAAAGRPCGPSLLVVLDEAANTAPIRNLPQIAATAAGQGIQVVTVFQDLAQARSRYGEAADTILANHRAKLFLSGISDGRTLEYLGRALGDEEVGYESRTRGERGSTSRTRGTRTRRLAPADAVRGIAPGEAILVYGHLPPARLSLRPWYRERSLRGLAAPQGGTR